MLNLILSIFTVFLLAACVGGSATGDGALPGGVGQAQPVNQEVSEVAPATPVEPCEKTDPNCKAEEMGLTNPQPPPPDPPDGPGDLTL